MVVFNSQKNTFEPPNPNKPVEESTASPFSFFKFHNRVRHPIFSPYILSDYETATPHKYTRRSSIDTTKKD